MGTEELMLLNYGAGEDSQESPWTVRKSNQSNLNEINPEYSLEGLMLKLKLQYFGHLMWRANSMEKILMLGKIEGKRRRGQQRIRLLHSVTESLNMSLSKLWRWWRTEEPGVLQCMGSQRIRQDLVTEQQQHSCSVTRFSYHSCSLTRERERGKRIKIHEMGHW